MGQKKGIGLCKMKDKKIKLHMSLVRPLKITRGTTQVSNESGRHYDVESREKKQRNRRGFRRRKNNLNNL